MAMNPPLKLRYVIWETTRRCDQVCRHCVNASGKAAPGELSASEAEALVHQIIDMGVEEVGMTGGESYLRRGIYDLVETLTTAGLRVRMQTGGYTLTSGRAQRLEAAGLTSLGVSIDGLRESHDRVRGRAGSFDAAIQAIKTARAAGLDVGVNTQINALSLGELPELCRRLRDLEVSGWQLVLTLPAGRAAEHPEWILQPWQVLDAIETLAALQQAAWDDPLPHEVGRPFNINPGANLGYFGPHELTLRSTYGRPRHWSGPQAGLASLFISAEGDVKGSTFLPGARYHLGNLREASLTQIWGDDARAAYTRRREASDLWGHCKGCYYADVCHGGDILTGEVFFGRRGNQAHCWHRAHTLKSRGLRERLVPLGHRRGGVGPYTLVEEAWADGDTKDFVDSVVAGP